MKKITFFCSLLVATTFLSAQNNIISTNPTAGDILLGNYNVADYLPAEILNHPDDIIPGIQDLVSADSLKSYIIKLSEFGNRNTGADTVSTSTGMGAARRWVHQKFEAFSANQDNRLVSSYLQFDQDICGMGQHRNIFTVLPGVDPNDHSVVIIEGHIDSRCESLCDIDCQAEGVEDNASGTALVIELARVMSHFSYNKTIVFMATIGEEQGLYGAEAFAKYAQDQGISIAAVLNNDVVGGVICGATSSEPGCPSENHIDSLQVRIFSSGFTSRNKNLARYSKLEYEEELRDLVPIPMQITIMSAEDRTGRGGDHIPFRQKGYASIRYTSANEHGNADVSDPDYHDRQHTMEDILGVDTDGDEVIDSFFVDFNYLARNTVINGVTAGLAAISPNTPEFEISTEDGIATLVIHDPARYDHYRIGFQESSLYFDSLYTITNDSVFTYPFTNVGVFFFTVMSVDSNGIESLLAPTVQITNFILDTQNPQTEEEQAGVKLLQNRPNPFDEATYINFWAKGPAVQKEARLVVRDMKGKTVKTIELSVQDGLNEVLYEHGYGQVGTYIYSLYIEGKMIGSKKMVFAN